MTRNTKTNTIVIVTAIATLLSATAAFANTTSNNTVQTPKFSQKQSGETNCWFKIRLDSLVKDGTIIKAQEDAIQSAVTIANQDAAANGDFQSVDNCGSKYVMDSLVKDGTITKAQEIAIQSAVTIAKEDGTIIYGF